MNPHPTVRDPEKEEQASLWAARLEGSVLSADDRVALDAWLAADPAHRPLLSAYCQFSADLEQQIPLLSTLDEPASAISPAAPPARRWLPVAGAALAAAAVAVVFWASRAPLQQGNIATAVAQRQEVTLADGSKVELNAQTSLVIELGPTERRVRLASGEAFFSVSKDPARPFVVETPAGSVRVTGTKFNVRAETAATLEVTVLEGTVQARPAGAGTAPIVLAAGDALVAGPAVTRRSHLSAGGLDAELAWRRGQVVFNDTPLSEALARFARYHGRGISAAPEVANFHVGGTHSLDDLDGFFAELKDLFPNLQVTRDGLSGTTRVELSPAR